MQQWSTSMSGSATPFLLSLLSRWVVLSFFLHWKPAQYQRFHWLSERVTATPSPPHWSAVKAGTCVVGGRDALHWFLGYRRGAEGNGVVVYREVIDLQGQTFNIGEVVFEFKMSNANRALICLLQLEDSVLPNNIRIFVNTKQKLRVFTRIWFILIKPLHLENGRKVERSHCQNKKCMSNY